MINSLLIKNFQSHKKTELEFDEGINVITGDTDSGKSAIVRALNWAINNDPSGEEFRSTWGGKTKVKLTTDKYIIRERGKGNFYKIQGVKKPLVSFKTNVPDEIKELLNFSSLNMQEQFDSPFLLAMSGGEVARYLNKIVHLDIIDKSHTNIQRVLGGEQQELKTVKASLKEDKKKAKTFYWIGKAEGCLVKLEQFQGILQSKKDKNRALGLLLQNLEGWEEEIKEVSKLTQHEEKVNKLITAEKILKKNQKKAGRLYDTINNTEQIRHLITDIGKEVKEWEQEFEELMPEQCPLCGRGG